MDKTSYCRDKCASSADMLGCMRDCLGRPLAAAGPVSPFRSMASKLRYQYDKTPSDTRKIVLGVAVVAAVAGLVIYIKKKKGFNVNA